MTTVLAAWSTCKSDKETRGMATNNKNESPWQSKTFYSVTELIEYEADSPLPAETFDETLYSLLMDHHWGGRLPDSVWSYLAQRIVQYAVVTGGFEQVLAQPKTMATAADVYRKWGRNEAATAIEAALEERATWQLGNKIVIRDVYDYFDENPEAANSIVELERSVSYEQWSANPERLAHVREHREDFLGL